MRTRTTHIALTVALLLQWGCLRGPIGWQRLTLNTPISAEDVAFIKDGHTSFQDVIDKLGSPSQILPAPDGIVARYNFTDVKYFRADFGWGLRFLLPFVAPSLVLGGGGIGHDVFQVTYNTQWIARDHSFAHHAQSTEYRIWPFKD